MKDILNANLVEAWLDDHPDFASSYFLRKASSDMVHQWHLNREDRTSSTRFNDVIMQSKNRMKEHATRKKSVIDPKLAMIASSRDYDEMVTSSLVTSSNGAIKKKVTIVDSPNVSPRKKGQKEKFQKILKTRRITQYQRPDLNDLNNDVCSDVTGDDDVIDERDMIMDLVMDITTELDLETVTHRILQNVSILLNADRCSLFQMSEDKKHLVSRLFDIGKESSLQDTIVPNKNKIKIELGKGIAGLVAKTGQTLNIRNAYKDSRFDNRVDTKTGYHTKTILCMPIFDSDRKVIGVAQVINKSEGHFTEKDEKVFGQYLGFCGIALHNAAMFERLSVENKRNEVLLELARLLFAEQNSLSIVIDKILLNVTTILQCEMASVRLIKIPDNPDSVKQTYEHIAHENMLDKDINLENVPFSAPLMNYVQHSRTPVNISDPSEAKNLPFEMEEHICGFNYRNILCVPVYDGDNQVIGAIQLLNKSLRSGSNKFTRSDEILLEAFNIFCGLGISHARMYEAKAKLSARQQVVLEVLSYHAIAPKEEYNHLMVEEIPSSKKLDLFSFHFNDHILDDDKTMKASYRMFIDLDLFNKFQIDQNVFCKWLASVKRNYRPVKYHNWRHAFNVCQTTFAMLTMGGLGRYFDDIERLALLVSCLCHDLDHRGRNNAFQAKIEHPLARLYSTSTLENHHLDQCLMILQSEGCEILSQLNQSEYSHVIELIRHSIISTDLAIYFQRKGQFFECAQKKDFDWNKNNNRALLRSMLVTGSDIAGITRPWEVQYKIAQELAEEFFEQGDFERSRLQQQPIELMDRELKHKLPSMQVGFIDAICMPLYEHLYKVSPDLKPLLEGCQNNRKKWKEESDREKTVTVF